MSDKMKRVLFTILLFCIIGVAFSDSIVPSVVNGPFEATLEFKNQTDKLDVVILLPKNWAISSYDYVGGKLVNEEIEIVNISGNKAVGVHFSFENVSYLSLNVKVIPTNNSGKLAVYYIFPGGFSKEVYKVNVNENKANLLIPILLMVLPPASYFLIERNKSRIEEKMKRRRRRKK